MRIRPDAAALLSAVRPVIDAEIAPHLTGDTRDALARIAAVTARAEASLARDGRPSPGDLAEFERAYAALRGEILAALPSERRYDARLVAKALSVAVRQFADGDAHERAAYDRLGALLGLPADPRADVDAVRCALPSRNAELVARIRAGEADEGSAAHAATLAHLEAATDEALAESNPAYPRRPGRGGKSGSVEPSGDANPLDLWLQIGGSIGDAMAASGNAVLASQTEMIGWFTRRLAASPHVPMFAVESAHQMHDLSVAIADISSAFMMLALAPFRLRVAEQRHAVATRPR